MANQSTPTPRPTPTPTTLASERPGIRDVWEVARLPALFAVIAAAATWLIWYYTSTPCTLELAARTDCNPAQIARYVNVDIFGRMLTYAAITAAAGGVWNYDMFTKMRAVIAAEKQRADEAEKLLAEYREQVAEERRQRDEEARRRADEAQRQAAEEQRLAAEERRQAIDEARRRADEAQRLAAEERRQAAEDRQAFLAALSEITAELAHLRQQRNGDANGRHDQ